MTTIVRRALATSALATVAAGAVLLFTSGIVAPVVDVYLIVLAAVVMLALYRVEREIAHRPQPSRYDLALARLGARDPGKAPELVEARDVVLSRLGAFHYHIRVRPVLREFADLRLRSRYGVDLAREPERARELVPSRAWEVVRPDRPPPANRLGRGPSVEEQRQVLDELERLDG